MDEQQHSNTAKNSAEPGRKVPGKASGKPFTKGDARINRKGRPRSFDALRALAQQIAVETAMTQSGPIVIDGHVATNVELVLREMMKGRQRLQFLEIAYGKVPNVYELTGANGGPLQVQAFNYGAAIAEIAGGSSDDREASGADEGDLHRPALGEDADGR